MAGYLVSLEPCDSGLTVTTATIVKGVTKPEGTPLSVVINASSAQIQGVMGYLGLIKAGSDTSTVETAITALTP